MERDEQPVGGLAGDAGAELKLGCGSSGESHADDPVAARLPRVAAGVEAEGLAGAGRADEDVHEGTGLRDRVNGSGLVGTQRRSVADRRIDYLSGDEAAPGPDACKCQLDGATLDGQHLGRRPALRNEVDRLARFEELVGARLDVVERTALGRVLGDRADDITALEGGVGLGDACGDVVVALVENRRADERRKPFDGDPEPLGARCPSTPEFVLGDVLGLRVAGVERGGLGGLGR